VEPDLAYLPDEVAGVGLAKSVGLLGEQADEEVGPAEVPVAEAFGQTSVKRSIPRD
jgi:hypothetical protein